jgi:hypothetical protein
VRARVQVRVGKGGFRRWERGNDGRQAGSGGGDHRVGPGEGKFGLAVSPVTQSRLGSGGGLNFLYAIPGA